MGFGGRTHLPRIKRFLRTSSDASKSACPYFLFFPWAGSCPYTVNRPPLKTRARPFLLQLTCLFLLAPDIGIQHTTERPSPPRTCFQMLLPLYAKRAVRRGEGSGGAGSGGGGGVCTRVQEHGEAGGGRLRKAQNWHGMRWKVGGGGGRCQQRSRQPKLADGEHQCGSRCFFPRIACCGVVPLFYWSRTGRRTANKGKVAYNSGFSMANNNRPRTAPSPKIATLSPRPRQSRSCHARWPHPWGGIRRHPMPRRPRQCHRLDAVWWSAARPTFVTGPSPPYLREHQPP